MFIICYNIPLRLAHKGCIFHCWFGHGVKPEMSWHLHKEFENILVGKYLWMKYVNPLLLYIHCIQPINYSFYWNKSYIDIFNTNRINKKLLGSKRIHLSLSPSILANIVLGINLMDLGFQGLDAPVDAGAGDWMRWIWKVHRICLVNFIIFKNIIFIYLSYIIHIAKVLPLYMYHVEKQHLSLDQKRHPFADSSE